MGKATPKMTDEERLAMSQFTVGEYHKLCRSVGGITPPQWRMVVTQICDGQDASYKESLVEWLSEADTSGVATEAIEAFGLYKQSINSKAIDMSSKWIDNEPQWAQVIDKKGEGKVSKKTGEPVMGLKCGLLQATAWGAMILADEDMGVTPEGLKSVLDASKKSTVRFRLGKLGLNRSQADSRFPTLRGKKKSTRDGFVDLNEFKGFSFGGETLTPGQLAERVKPQPRTIEAPPTVPMVETFDVTAHVSMLLSRGLDDSQILGIIMAKPDSVVALYDMVFDILLPAPEADKADEAAAK